MPKRRKRLPTMGPLEQAAMDILWASGARMSVREVAGQLDEGLAYTTVMTVLVRLHDKGMVTRRRAGRGFEYRPKISRTDYAARTMSAALGAAPNPSEVLHQFVGEMSAQEQAALRSILEADDR